MCIRTHLLAHCPILANCEENTVTTEDGTEDELLLVHDVLLSFGETDDDIPCPEEYIGSFSVTCSETGKMVMGGCLRCPPDSQPNAAGTSCHCRAGYYQVDDLELFQWVDIDGYTEYVESPSFGAEYPVAGCAECPAGADCRNTGTSIGTVVALAGWFPGVDASGSSLMTIFFPCLNDYCVGDGMCDDGYTGNSCTECDEGLIQVDGFHCSNCAGAMVQLLLVVVGCIAFGVFLFLSQKDIGTKITAERHEIFLKIFISGVQVMMLALSFSFNFDTLMEDMLKSAGEVTTIGTAYLEFGCIFEDGNAFVLETLFLLMLPVLMILVLLGILNLVHTVPQQEFQSQKGENDEERESSHKSSYTPSTRDLVFGLACIILFFFHPTLTAVSAEMFSCECFGKVNDTSQEYIYYLRADLGIQCYTTQHSLLIMGLGIPTIAIYVIGIPVAALYFIVTSTDEVEYLVTNNLIQHELNDQIKAEYELRTAQRVTEQGKDEMSQRAQSFFSRFGFLLIGYEPRVMWWEIVITARKVLMTLLSTLLQRDRHLQAILAELVMMWACILHVQFGPYVDGELDRYEFVSLVSTSLIFFCGAITQGPNSDSYREFASAFSVIVFIGFVVYTVVFAVTIYKTSMNRKASATQLDDLQEHESGGVELSTAKA